MFNILMIIALAGVPFTQSYNVPDTRPYIGKHDEMNERQALGVTACILDGKGQPDCRIVLHPCLFEGNIDVEVLMETYVHELAHYVDFMTDGYIADDGAKAGHGAEWSKIMISWRQAPEQFVSEIPLACQLSLSGRR